VSLGAPFDASGIRLHRVVVAAWCCCSYGRCGVGWLFLSGRTFGRGHHARLTMRSAGSLHAGAQRSRCAGRYVTLNSRRSLERDGVSFDAFVSREWLRTCT